MPAPRKHSSSSAETLRAARSRRYAYTSCSGLPGGRSIARSSRTLSGMSANSSSIDPAPMRSSIAGSLSRTRTSQPSPYGSSLIRSGASPSASLISTISPDSGATTSDTALTDSISAYGSSLVSVAPISGGSRNTTSPSWSWAYQVMPNVAVSPSIRAQSCSGWYLTSSGLATSGLLAVERLLAYLGGAGAAAHVDL